MIVVFFIGIALIIFSLLAGNFVDKSYVQKTRHFFICFISEFIFTLGTFLILLYLVLLVLEIATL